MKHGRLHWYTPAELSADQRAVYDAIAGGPRAQGPQAFRLTDDDGRLEGPFNALLVSPEVGGPIQALGSAIRYRTTLSNRAREIAILELARLRRCEFEWFAHERVGRAAGVSDAELAGLQSGADVPTLDATETAVRVAVRALVTTRDLDDATFERARTALGERSLIELIALVGYYDLLALSLTVCRTPLPRGAVPTFTAEPEGQ